MLVIFRRAGTTAKLSHLIGQQVQQQASFLAYTDGFWVVMLIALTMVPLAFTLRNAVLGGAAPAAH